MAPGPSTEGLSEAERARLLALARAAIVQGLGRAGALPEAVSHDASPALRAPGASFVTLKRFGQLRGCVGSLEAVRPLVEDVAHNARAAAFHDPRFTPLTADELADLEIGVTLIGAAEPIAFRDEQDLLAQLVPGVDGLIIEQGRRRATFLPQVWQTLPEARDFLRALKQKAGLEPDDCPEGLRAWRYRAWSFGAS
jgi:hypothetical protein